MITMGGNAEIELIDSMDPFSEGLSIQSRVRSMLIIKVWFCQSCLLRRVGGQSPIYPEVKRR